MPLRERVALAIRRADDAGNLLDSEIADAAIAEVSDALAAEFEKRLNLCALPGFEKQAAVWKEAIAILRAAREAAQKD